MNGERVQILVSYLNNFLSNSLFYFISKQYWKYTNNNFGHIFHKLFQCLLGFFNPNFSVIPVTKLSVLDCVLLYARLDPCCLREEGVTLVCLSAHHSQLLFHSVEARPSVFCSGFLGCM
jgi:hypothetical protein